VNLRLASEGDADAVSVRAYLRRAADATGSDGETLVAELERWVELADGSRSDELPQEEHYLNEQEGDDEALRARLEGFRQATGVLPAQFLELREEALRLTGSGEVALLDLMIAPALDEPSPPSPILE